MTNTTMVKIILLFTLLHTVHGVQRTPWARFREKNYPYSRLRFNITADDYFRLSEGILILGTRSSTDEYKGLQLLSTQNTNVYQPPEWILIDLVNQYGVATIAMRNDNFRFVGFTNSEEQWHEFELSQNQQLIPESIILVGVRGDYSFGSFGTMENVPLSKDNLNHAVQVLLDYRYPPTDAGQLALEEASAKILLMLCEAARFRPIKELIRSGWNSAGVFIPVELVPRVQCWGKISELLLTIGWPWPNTPEVAFVEARFKDGDFNTEEKYLAYINVLLRPRIGYTPASPPSPPS